MLGAYLAVRFDSVALAPFAQLGLEPLKSHRSNVRHGIFESEIDVSCVTNHFIPTWVDLYPATIDRYLRPGMPAKGGEVSVHVDQASEFSSGNVDSSQ